MFAAPYAPRVWAIEGHAGSGALVAQQLEAPRVCWRL